MANYLLLQLDMRRLGASGESRALHQGRRYARLTRRDDGEYRQYVTEKQRREPGCSAGRLQRDFRRGLLALLVAIVGGSFTVANAQTAEAPEGALIESVEVSGFWPWTG
jgi:hypothetical protein